VHRLDPAHLFGLALEKGSAGARTHRIAEEGVPFRDIAEVIGRRLNVPVVSTAPEEATNHFDWFVHFAALDSRPRVGELGNCWGAAETARADSRSRPAALFRNLNCQRTRRLCTSINE
jgi:hypothetical protein